jgi:hypothetical protein
MPRKKKEDVEILKTNSTVDELLSNSTQEYMIMQLPLTENIINKVINSKDIVSSKDPIAYQSDDLFINHSEIINDNIITSKRSVCYWCCHQLTDFSCGLPIKYTESLKHFDIFGIFCSFQCASAYNFSINSKSDKVWDINALINMLASKYGINENIRPAPSKYVLQLFGGEMTIEEFRLVHKENERSLVLNIPPMTTISASTELLNTSYIQYDTKGINSIETKLNNIKII